ncbi:hypothetical protein EUTSA_v10023902mg [Eutrema salsugineum]|uniref:Uncharacterized protein n=1 Tax=Eutrema salsugineum TaxID=72664 RepID=V4MDV6_EUTSA|nr:hypothetical protein EUTSA_v10023902mg [Eutrema salsugineum]
MAASKKSLTTFLIVTMVIILSLFGGIGEAGRSLGYGAIAKDTIPGCSSTNPKSCGEVPVNKYHRGCEKSERCRSDDSIFMNFTIKYNVLLF